MCSTCDSTHGADFEEGLSKLLFNICHLGYYRNQFSALNMITKKNKHKMLM